MIIHNEQDIIDNRNVAGIYRFHNKINDKSYVGQSVNIGKRIREHLCALKNPSRQYSIHKAILKYGIENFDIEILAVYEKVENIRKILNEAERIYIYIYDSFCSGYNETAGGDSMNKRKWTEEQRRKMKEAMTGKKRPADYVDPRSKAVYLYNYKTGEKFSVPCAKFVTGINCELKPGDVQACATGKQFSTRGFICAYSEENLDYKIHNFKFGKRCTLK